MNYPVDNPHSLEIKQILENLNVSSQKGLSHVEAEKRLKEFGFNTIAEGEKNSWLKILLSQFNNFLIYILLVGCLVSFLSGEYIDTAIILTVVLGIGFLGFFQEEKAQKDIEALKKLASPKCNVIREGKTQQINSDKVVPGDILVLQTGDIVAADVRLIKINKLTVNETCLTGESKPVAKELKVLPEKISVGDRKNLCFMGTVIEYGGGKGIVSATGSNTEFGKIAKKLLTVRKPETPLQIQIDKVGKQLGKIFLVICFLIFLLNFKVRNQPFIGSVMDSVALAIAAVPEGLTTVVTICLAIGVNKMKKRKALIKRLAAVETLGATDIICTDKTGTITKGEMEVVEFFLPSKTFGISELKKNQLDSDIKNFFNLIAACNDADQSSGTPTDKALFALTSRFKIKRVQNVDSNPFDPERKMLSFVYKIGNKYVSTVSGAPENIISASDFIDIGDKKSKLDQQTKDALYQELKKMAEKGLRVVAFAKNENFDTKPKSIKEAESNLVFVGLVGLKDPVHQEVVASIKAIKEAGIKPIMITGDYPETAFIIGKEAGIIDENEKFDEVVISGQELQNLSGEKLAELCRHKKIFARVSPEDKLKIVESLQKLHHVVAMSGDGVNDAPAIKKSDIGIAMGIRGTQVTRETASIVLLDDNYKTIANAIDEGRIIFKNIKLFVSYLLSTNFSEILIFAVSIILVGPVPFNARMILWLNLVTDFLPALSMAYEKGDIKMAKEKPRPVGAPLIDRYIWIHISVQTIIITIIALSIYMYFSKINPLLASTAVFVNLSLAESFKAVTSRSGKYLIFEIGMFKNKINIYALIISALLTLAVVYVPIMRRMLGTTLLPFRLLVILALLALITPFIQEITKIVIRVLKIKAY